MQMNFIDIFSGIGGFRLGLEMAGHQCIGHCEMDKFSNKAYEKMHLVKENEWFAENIELLKSGDIPRSDMWCFGFPCQDISVGGRQSGLEGSRSGLFYKVIELVKGKKEEDKPSVLLIENVKNLFSVNGGWDFARVLYKLDEAGYDAEWQLINSSWYVPQNRERIFIVGHIRGRSRRKVFPISRSCSENLKTVAHGKQGESVYNPDGIGCTLLGNGGGHGGKTGLYFLGNINPSGKGMSGNVYGSNGIAPTLTASDYKSPPKITVNAVLTPQRIEKRQNGRRIKNGNEPMFTLTANDVHGVLISEATKKGYTEALAGDSINFSVPGSSTRRGRVGKNIANTLDTACNQGTLTKGRIRRLTPLECFRLQGFPDEYFYRAKSAGLSDTRLYKCAGNSVTVNVTYDIGKRLN
nr:DNA (cytosine-5-)-methyltransferase [Clostridium sp. 19966]